MDVSIDQIRQLPVHEQLSLAEQIWHATKDMHFKVCTLKFRCPQGLAAWSIISTPTSTISSISRHGSGSNRRQVATQSLTSGSSTVMGAIPFCGHVFVVNAGVLFSGGLVSDFPLGAASQRQSDRRVCRRIVRLAEIDSSQRSLTT